MVRVPVRESLPRLASTRYCTIPGPLPLPQVTLRNGAPLTVVQGQPAGAVTRTSALRARAENVAAVGSRSTTLAADALAAAALSAGRGSKTAEPTVARAVRRVPSAIAQPTVAVRVTVAVAPAARVGKETVRSPPVPGQTPPPVAAHAAPASPAGSVTRTTAPSAASGPRSVTVKV